MLEIVAGKDWSKLTGILGDVCCLLTESEFDTGSETLIETISQVD